MFSGSIVALITPFGHDGEVDYVSLKRLINFHVESGTDAIVSIGTTGECSTLSTQERINVVERTIEYAHGRIPVIAGTGSNSTHEALFFLRMLSRTGIAACLSVTPYYNKPTQEGMFLHYRAISEETDIPQILYNVPGRTGVDIHPETVSRLSDLDTIIGIKDATGDLNRVKTHRELCGNSFALLSGDDTTGLNFIKLGGNGIISVTSNVAASDMAKMASLAIQGHIEEAQAIDQRLRKLHEGLFTESNPIPIKWAAQKIGLINDGALRLPMTTISSSATPVLRQALVDLGFL